MLAANINPVLAPIGYLKPGTDYVNNERLYPVANPDPVANLGPVANPGPVADKYLPLFKFRGISNFKEFPTFSVSP
jgi:hypothetical protein